MTQKKTTQGFLQEAALFGFKEMGLNVFDGKINGFDWRYIADLNSGFISIRKNGEIVAQFEDGKEAMKFMTGEK